MHREREFYFTLVKPGCGHMAASSEVASVATHHPYHVILTQVLHTFLRWQGWLGG